MNPFNPAPGAAPSAIIGRDPELSAIRETNRRAKIGQAANPLIFLGQRGIGKTVLLGELRRLGGAQSLPVVIEALSDRTITERFHLIIDELLDSVEPLPSRAAATIRRTIKALPKISYELPHDGGEVSLSSAARDESLAHRHDPLGVMLATLFKAAQSAKRYLTITIDEVQNADLRSMQTITAFVHEQHQAGHGLVLALAGLDRARDLLDQLPTYVRRWDTYELGYLTKPETIDAIRSPIVDAGGAIDEDALYSLAEESAGYPFFIQAYASAAWNHSKNHRITKHDVEKTLPDVRERHAVSTYQRPLARLTPRELALALVLADLGEGRTTWGDVARAIGREAKDISSTRGALETKGIIGSPIPGEIEFSIPLMGRYLREHAAHYRDADVDAALAALRESKDSRSAPKGSSRKPNR